MPQRMLVVVNPYATAVSGRLRERALATLARGYDVEASTTEAPGHGVELARRAAADGFDAVTALGGDGTVNEVANGLAGSRAGGERPPTALACLPGGQANVFVKMLGMPHGGARAAEHLLELSRSSRRPRRFDLGVVDGRCFTFCSGLGLDADVTRRVDSNPRLKRRLGPWYYSWCALAVLTRRYLAHPPRLTVTLLGDAPQTAADGGDETAAPARARAVPPALRPLAGITAVVQNGSPYTYFGSRPIALAADAALDSGTLAGAVLRRASALDLPGIAWRALAPGRYMAEHRQIDSFGTSRALVIASADGRTVPLHVDGDFIGEVTQARYSVLPGALAVLA